MKSCAVFAVVPARGGSRGIPRKNLAPVAGRPLIAWTLDAAAGARCIDRLIVSTDDEDIARVARDLGADVPFRRPASLAKDDTPGIEPILHAVRWLEQHKNTRPDAVMILQPTSPLRVAADLDAAASLFTESGADGVISVTLAEAHPSWTRRIDENGALSEFMPGSPTPPRRQELEPVYALNGAVYLARLDALRKHRTYNLPGARALIMPAERSLDVDTPWHLRLADLALRERNRQAGRPT